MTRLAHDVPLLSASIVDPVLMRMNSMVDQASGGRGTILGLTAARRGEGVTTLTLNLGLALAERFGKRVLLVDANARAPGIASAFGSSGETGLNDVIGGRVAPAEGVQTLGERLAILPAGSGGEAQGLFLDDPRLPALMRMLEERFDLVLFDCPPVERIGETAALARQLSGLLFVIDAGRTRRGLAQRALADLVAAGGKPVGAILNRRQEPIPAWLYRLL